MKIIRGFIVVFWVVFFVFGQAATGFSQKTHRSAEKKIDGEFQWLREEAAVIFVVTAARVKENIKRSSSSITVITDDQIRRMGARHLMDVINRVPGMSAWYHGDGHYQIDTRGTTKVGGQDILLMIDSHPLNSNLTGGATWTYDTLSLENVKQIEVIRGPGSALYGANAFSGVINIITKNGDYIDGVQASASYGTYQRQQYNLLFGKMFGDLEVAFNFNYFNTDGYDPYIEADSQTLTDRQVSQMMPVSLKTSIAPDNADSSDEQYDAYLRMEYNGLEFNGKYIERKRKPCITPLYGINKDSQNEPVDYYLNLSYTRELWEGMELIGKVYHNHNEWNPYYQGYPNAPVVTPTGLSFLNSDGLIAEPSVKNNRTGIELQGNYRLTDNNLLVAGVTYEKMKQYDVTYAANFMYTPVQGVIVPLYSVQELTSLQNINSDASREFKALFVQDIWDIRDDLRLTLGFRYDDYSDFGESFNPRGCLVWEYIKGYDLKLIYGRAFRAPSFQELYFQNNPSTLGNPDLNPEIVDTYEVSLGAQFTRSFDGRLTAFRNEIKDNIGSFRQQQTTQNVFENKDKIRSQGIELEMKYAFTEGTYLSMNYTYQDAINLDTDERFTNIPRHKGNVMFNYQFNEMVNFYVDYHFQKGYSRQTGDPRDDNEGFDLYNTTLIVRDFWDALYGLELRGSIYNIFNEKYTTPYSVGSLPIDLPMPGQSFIFEVRYTF